jgi:hypothetical protein
MKFGDWLISAIVVLGLGVGNILLSGMMLLEHGLTGMHPFHTVLCVVGGLGGGTMLVGTFCLGVKRRFSPPAVPGGGI